MYSPTMPLTTREARIPVSSPERIIPTFFPLVSGVEYCAARGMNIWGITEQAPVSREANSIRWILGAKAMVSSETTRMEIFTRIIFLLRYKSPSGMMNNSPMAYPICEHMAIRLAVNSLMFRSRLIRFSSGWL